jgi:hypothetical protein
MPEEIAEEQIKIISGQIGYSSPLGFLKIGLAVESNKYVYMYVYKSI